MMRVIIGISAREEKAAWVNFLYKKWSELATKKKKYFRFLKQQQTLK